MPTRAHPAQTTTRRLSPGDERWPLSPVLGLRDALGARATVAGSAMKRTIPVEEFCRVPKTQKDRKLTLASRRPRTKSAVFSSSPMARCSPEPTAAIRRAHFTIRSDARTSESSAGRDVSPRDFLSPRTPTLNRTAARATSVPAVPVPATNPSVLPVLSVVGPLIRFPLPLVPRSIPPCSRCPPRFVP